MLQMCVSGGGGWEAGGEWEGEQSLKPLLTAGSHVIASNLSFCPNVTLMSLLSISHYVTLISPVRSNVHFLHGTG